MSEARDRLIINELLKESDWILPNLDGKKPNVDVEVRTDASGITDYTLYDNKKFPICILEAKSKEKNPLIGKEAARGYAKSSNCRFVILSNSETHYLWDIEIGSPILVSILPSLKELEIKRDKFKPNTKLIFEENINEDYVVLSQFENYQKDPDYIDEKTRVEFCEKNRLRFLRPYQIKAVNSIRNAIKKGSSRFLLEMATGTGKTLTASAIVKMFLRSENANRVLFLVDRLELENQAEDDFQDYLKKDYTISIWKENKTNWKNSKIVISTIQSLLVNNKYKKLFNRDDFDLIVSDEAHRSLGGASRNVFEYFIGYKLGLTATPKNFLKAIDRTSLGMRDPRELERRTLLDTYNTFGCEDNEPTFRYTLLDGVRDKVLVNPKVFDARTEITTELLSKEGYIFSYIDKEGNHLEGTFYHKNFERKFFSEETNKILCKTFLENCKRDPFTHEVGKTLIFCVSQNHASKVVQILNQFADQMFPEKYFRSDFAVQITSSIPNAQDMSQKFKFNSLLGNSRFDENYKTSRARVCVTVGMMTTGYDARDILNICLMRPIFSPSEFIQMKGRGTRIFDFSTSWISKKDVDIKINSKKDNFYLFDFFGNCQYFEDDFNYDSVIKLSLNSENNNWDVDQKKTKLNLAENLGLDSIQSIKQIDVGAQGMKIDRVYFNSFEVTIKDNYILAELVKQKEFDKAEKYLQKNIFKKPDKFFSLDLLKKSLNLDRNISTKELLLYVYGYTDKIKLREECEEEEFLRFDNIFKINDDNFDDIKKFFYTYLNDSEFRNIVDSKEFAKLSTHPMNDVVPRIPNDMLSCVPTYIKNHNILYKFI